MKILQLSPEYGLYCVSVLAGRCSFRPPMYPAPAKAGGLPEPTLCLLLATPGGPHPGVSAHSLPFSPLALQQRGFSEGRFQSAISPSLPDPREGAPRAEMTRRSSQGRPHWLALKPMRPQPQSGNHPGLPTDAAPEATGQNPVLRTPRCHAHLR